MDLCNVCREVDLGKLLRGCQTQQVSSLRLSALTCKLCNLVFNALYSDERHSWWAPAPKNDEKVVLRARGEPPFAVDQRGLTAARTRIGHRITYIDIMYGYRCCGALSVFAQEDDPLALSGDLLARPLSLQVSSPQTFQKISCWIQECNLQHRLCQHLRKDDLEARSPSPPSRLLDLSLDDKSDDVRLVETGQGRFEYAALSHCWGKIILQQTTKETLSAQLMRVRFEDLNQTFRDAVIIARGLGINYLWIDSLCIIQDDKTDWEIESAKMGDIYRQATLTIAAAASSDGSGGCFKARRPPVVEQIQMRQTSSTGEEGTMQIGVWTGDFIRAVSNGPLNSRGWVLQERILASRTIHFAREQVYWECDQMTLGEDGRQHFHSDSLRHILSPFPHLHPQYLASKQSQKQFIYDRWYAVVENYTSRNLTKSDDIFPALSGISKALARMTADRYLAGLWQSMLHVGLLWQAKGRNWGSLSRPRTPRAPSWSWAAVDGPISYLASSRIRHTSLEFAAIVIHDAHCEIVGENPWGSVKTGLIRLTGIIKPAILAVGLQTDVPGYEIQSQGDLVGTGYPDVSIADGEELAVLRVARSSENVDEPGLFWFTLLLQRSNGSLEGWERVGMGKVTRFDWFDGTPERALVLS